MQFFPAFPVKLPDYPLYFIENFQCSASDIGKKLDREELKESILILKELEEKKYVFKEKLVTCDVQETQNIVLHFESSPYTVQLGRGNMDVKLAKLNALLDNLSKNNKSAKYIDFRFRDEAVVKLN